MLELDAVKLKGEHVFPGLPSVQEIPVSKKDGSPKIDVSLAVCR